MLKDNPKLYSIYYNTTDYIKNLFNKYYYILIIIIVVVFAKVLFNINDDHNIKIYNQKIFNTINVDITTLNQDSVDEFYYDKLIELYSDKKLYQTNKTLIGLNLAKHYKKNNNLKEAENIYKQIFSNEKDLFLTNLAGLNLFSLLIQNEITNKKTEVNTNIDLLYKKLDDNKNTLFDLVQEQYIIYLLEIGKKDLAKNIINILKNKDISETLNSRLNEYNKIYRLNLI